MGRLLSPIEIERKIRSLGFRWTRPRREVVGVFSRHAKPMTIQEIFTRMDAKDIDLVSVYRSVHLFVKHGILVFVDSVSEGRRYEFSEPYRPHHHHHIVCQACGDIQEINSCGVEKLETGISRQTGYQILSHDLRFVGLCGDCR